MNTELHERILERLEELYMEEYLTVQDYNQAFEEVREQILNNEFY